MQSLADHRGEKENFSGSYGKEEIELRLLSRSCLEVRCGEDVARFGGELAGNGFLAMEEECTWVHYMGRLSRQQLIQRVNKYCETQSFQVEFISEAQRERMRLTSPLAAHGTDYSLLGGGPFHMGPHPLVKAICVELACLLIFGAAGFPAGDWYMAGDSRGALFVVCIIGFFGCAVLLPFTFLFCFLSGRREKKLLQSYREAYLEELENVLDLRNRGSVLAIWKEQERQRNADLSCKSPQDSIK